jgi:NADP-dependent 3-hydroxy acid dehydrogenase YdfG
MSSTTADSARPLAGQSAVITGASRGIGLAITRVLHHSGARVILLARSRDALAKIGDGLGAGAVIIEADLGDARSVAAASEEIRAACDGPPDIVVNNAALFLAARLEDTSIEEFERIVRVNLIAQFALVRAFVSEMKARSRGHVVTIGSTADRHIYPENAAYAASKFGARALHEVLREELRGSGVRATLVSPGPVDTTLWDEVNPDARPGFSPRAAMLDAAAVADAVRYAVTRAPNVNVDELRLSRS